MTALLERLPVGVGIVDAEGQVISMNPAGLRLHGFASLDDMLGHRARYSETFELQYTDGRPMPEDAWPLARALRGDYVHEYEVRLRRLDGEEKVVSYSVVPVRAARGAASRIVFVMHDVTDRRRAEDALRRSEAEFRSLFELSAVGSVQVDPATGRFVRVNRRFCEITGYTEAELLTRTFHDLTHPDDHATDQTIADAVLQGAPDRLETEKRYVRADGESVWVHVAGRLLVDPHGRPYRSIANVVDITERKRAEAALREREEQLRELNQTLERRVADRTADLGERNKELQTFAYVASHDLREPLRKIQSFGEMLAEEAGAHLGDDARHFLERMRSAAGRMDGLLSDLLAFSRVATQTTPFEDAHVGEVVADVLADYELVIRETGAEVDVDADVTVQADVHQLRQLLTNLVGNAFKYRHDDRAPHLRISAALVPGAEHTLDEPDGPACRIVVEDNGIGFEATYSETIFEPFQRLHGQGVYEGTGMGLAICRRIVQRHRGRIVAESALGEGSQFIVHLPARQTAGPEDSA